MKMMKYFVRIAVSIMVMAFCAISAQAFDKSYYADTSKLATGKWVKICVSESGIYQITADDIRSWGLGTDLSTIHVFGYGGAPLSEKLLTDNYADDLPQMPIVRTSDRILFYAQGPTTWRHTDSIPHLQLQHPYAISGSYFVTNDSRFNDIDIEKATNTPAGEVLTTYIERQLHEQELVNPGETGSTFLGESFVNNRTQTFKFDLSGRVSNANVTMAVAFAAKAPNNQSKLTFSCNGTALPSSSRDIVEMSGTSSHTHYIYNNRIFKTFSPESSSDLNISVNYACGGTVYLARLDYLTINFERELAMRRGGLVFGLNESVPHSYRVSECGEATHVWDVTRPFAPIQLNAVTSGGSCTFAPAALGHREIVAFDESGSFSKPEFIGEVANQNIHGEPVPDMIILAPSAYLEQARRVAALHEQIDNFRVLVLDHEKVFNEFSSGTRDAMAYRRLCKMFYDRGATEDGHQLGYLLLFGGGSYNNRQVVGTDASTPSFPRLLTWQSRWGADEDGTYTTDDYFGILGDESTIGHNEKLDISVGRMLAKSVSEARTVVNKLVKYVTKPVYGAWKNQIMFVADDENKGIHMTQSMNMDKIMNANDGQDLVRSYVFIDAFEFVSEGGSRTYPDARAKMFSTLNEGTLWWNYIGHSSTQNWTGEGLLKRADVESSLFYKRLPVLYAATCEFLRFDNSVTSSGELVYGNANGGAIAVICSPRLAEIGSNGALSDALARYVFSRDEKGRQRRIGDILRLAKNDIWSSGDNKRRFFVFGDPAMRLAYAPYTAKVETINGEPVDPDDMPVFKAREKVQFSGKILDLEGNVAPDFNGTIVSTLFGPLQSVTTHGYYSDPKHPEEGVKVTYEERPNRLAINVDTVSGGLFNVTIIIPSEVDKEYENFRPSLLNLYAFDRSNAFEAKGSNSDFYIYGYNDEEVTDTIGPRIITMGLNDDHFVNGSDVNESPLFLATVADESGVNFSTAGIGHNMTLTLDGVTGYNDVASYYTPMFAEQGTLGSINYQLNELTPGLHNLRLRVWDVYNNVSEKTIYFNVIQGLAPEIADVYCAANPASVETSFYVKHNRPDAIVSVTIEVYDLMGRKVWSTTQAGRSDMYTSTPVTWDLTDMGGRRVPRGIYVYRATISTDGIKEATKAKKLAVTGE